MIISIPIGVDLQRFHPRHPDFQLQSQLGMASGMRVVGTIAFLRDYKGIEDFLEAALLVLRRFPKTRFLVVGDGPERGCLEKRINDLGLPERVWLLGFRQDIPPLVSIIDVFVLPSIGGEGIPQALPQAMAMEKAVVAISVGGIPEALRDGVTGYLGSPHNPAELQQKIIHLLER